MWIFHIACSLPYKRGHGVVERTRDDLGFLCSYPEAVLPDLENLSKSLGFKFLTSKVRDLDYVFSTLYEPLKLNNSRDIFHMISFCSGFFGICVDF